MPTGAGAPAAGVPGEEGGRATAPIGAVPAIGAGIVTGTGAGESEAAGVASAGAGTPSIVRASGD
jgi:hypothetical protein